MATRQVDGGSESPGSTGAAPNTAFRGMLRGARILSDRRGFALEFQDAQGRATSVELPHDAVTLLMKIAPNIDAALLADEANLSSSLIAYPVHDWNVDSAGVDDGVAIFLRTSALVEAAFHFSLDDARTFHEEFGRSLRRALDARQRGGKPPT